MARERAGRERAPLDQVRLAALHPVRPLEVRSGDAAGSDDDRDARRQGVVQGRQERQREVAATEPFDHDSVGLLLDRRA